jgi:tetratricopeptide (TPR) repeat protein
MMQNGIDDISRAKLNRSIETFDFDGAVEILNAMEQRCPLSPRELVLKARCLQLGSGALGDELEKAEAALKAALASDEEYVPALVELGWFLYAVADDALGGKKLFERAFEVSSRDWQEALAGLFKTIVESESESAALEALENRVRKSIDIHSIRAKSRERSGK